MRYPEMRQLIRLSRLARLVVVAIMVALILMSIIIVICDMDKITEVIPCFKTVILALISLVYVIVKRTNH